MYDNKEEAKLKKQRNKEWSTAHLVHSIVPFESKNNGNHLLILDSSGLNTVAHFWPSTGKYKILGKHDYGRGVHNLIKQLEIIGR